MPSVVIPAHNEEATIGDCVGAVLASDASLEVVVVANACTDATADVVRRVAPSVTVVETATPGKTNALNLGERHVSTFPRAYLDGDIVLEPGALDAAFGALGSGIEIAAPPPRFDTTGASPIVRLFYDALRDNPYFGRGAPNGSGVFVVTESGRSRWEEFPEIISDDGFVDLHFARSEQRTADGPAAIVRTPLDLESLIAIQVRSRRGTIEIRERFPELWARQEFAGGSMLRSMCLRPWRWPAALAYGWVRFVERRRIARAPDERGWARDRSSREGASRSERLRT